MTIFLSFLLILSAAVLIARAAAALSVPYPSFLALGGALLALLPGAPSIRLDPSLALVIFVAPVLLVAAFETTLGDLHNYRLSIVMLVVMAVGLTTIAVAIVFRELVPQAPWAAAVALGAIVAPPDAAAATAVLRGIKMPSRIVTILEGESLFNDASALLIFAVALRLTEDNSATLATLIPTYGAHVIGSIALGVALSWVVPLILRLAEDAPASIVLQFCSTFGIWILANDLQLSPILTVVAYGIALARRGPRGAAPLLRRKSFAVWETAVFLANVLAFTLIGMQLAPLLAGLAPHERTNYFTIAAAILFTVILVRILWVMAYNHALRAGNALLEPHFHVRVPPPTAKGGLIVAWCGMRGIVSLAAALALPKSFPERDLIQFVAFVVVFGTLVLQGFTLGPLVRWLQLPEDRKLNKEISLARRHALEAAIKALDGNATPYADALRLEYRALLDFEDDAADGDFSETPDNERLRLKANSAAQESLRKLRQNGEIGEVAFLRILSALDRAYLYATRYEPPNR